MAAARRAGIEIVWATARARHSVHEFALASGFRGMALCANGAVVLDLASGEPVITDVVAIDHETGTAAIARLRELVPEVMFASVGPSRFVAEPGYAELSVFADHHRDPEQMELSSEQPAQFGEPVVKIVARHPTVPGIDLYRAASAAGIARVALTHSGAPYLEMSAAGVSKARALERLCRDRGIGATQVAAIGDAVNDVPMLAWAGTALCPANAIAEVQALAHRVLPSNDDHAVAVYLEELVHAQRICAW
jgi:hydroxymethylpyrimidine pyrophosphatase-like HAD family hydrolase